MPTIAAGDYNFFDVRPHSSPDNDAGFAGLTRNNVLRWVRPEVLAQTQFDPRYDIDSILVLVLISGDLGEQEATSEILLTDKPREYFLTPAMTDHRPLSTCFRF